MAACVRLTTAIFPGDHGEIKLEHDPIPPGWNRF